MEKILNYRQTKFLIKSGIIIGSVMAFSDILTMLFYNPKSYGFALCLVEIMKMFVFDLGLSSCLMIILTIPFLLIDKLNVLAGKTFVYVFGIILIFSVLLLNKYYATTHLSLGSDLYGFSIDDLQMIVSSSTDFSLLAMWPFYTFPITFIILYKYFHVGFFNVKWFTSLVLIGILFLGFETLSKNTKITNLVYFVNDSIDFKKSSTVVKNQVWAGANAYPLLRKYSSQNDVLGQYLTLKTQKPNIILIVVEGLGRDFSGEDAEYPGFTPFLDSLSQKSLYWTNFVSNAGRSFGAIPSILGSVPFGSSGFLELNKLPSHISLIPLLKNYNYKTSYFEGGDAQFDHKLNYLTNEGMENIVDQNSYGASYTKNPSENGFSWGYPDKEIFKKTLTELKPEGQPRFDLIMTITNHEPFIFNGKESYLTRVKALSDKSNFSDEQKEVVDKYKDVFSTLLYTDDAIKGFINQYKSNPNYENTIFIITGDHRLIPIPQKDNICKYHVPLIIYSPMQIKAEKFKGICSHMDIMPSIVALLNNKYKEKSIEKVPWIGSGLSNATTFVNNHDIPLTKYKGAFKDYISGDLFLSENVLYKIDDKFRLEPDNSGEEQLMINKKFSEHQKINTYVTQNNKIIPPEMVIENANIVKFTKEEMATIKKYVQKKSPGEIYMVARNLAFNTNSKEALVLCNYILNINSNHFDTRTLKGRILAWSGNFEKSEKELSLIIERNPGYQDAYFALLDLYWWNGKPLKARLIAEKAQLNLPDETQFQKNILIAIKRFKNNLAIPKEESVRN
ncbi:MAG: LTA synthase family protein [Bacteroidota bacterium]